MTARARIAVALGIVVAIAAEPARSGTPSISAGGFHSVALKDDGTVRAWGSDNVGQLGIGRVLQVASPVAASGVSGVTAISAGYEHSIALKGDGRVLAWGWNSYGQLGDGTRTDRSAPVLVGGLTGAIAVAAGSVHAAALKGDGSVWTWGSNFRGELGDGTTSRRSIPAQVGGLTGAIAISAGSSYTMALKGDGTVWAWGSNTSGQLGDGTTADRYTPGQVAGLTGVVAISAGGAHAVALKSDGSAWGWGNNFFGQLGDGTTTSRTTPVQIIGLRGIVAISARGSHTVALRGDGSVWAWGLNDVGQLGDGTTIARSNPVPVSGLTGAVAISAGDGHTVALKGDGSAWAWGRNYFGELGDGTTTARSAPVQASGLMGAVAISAGGTHTIALKGDGGVWAWGSNTAGQLSDGSPPNRSAPAQAIGLTGVVAISAGANHSVALKGDGTAWAWGWNADGQLGDGARTARSVPARVNGLAGVVAISAGGDHTVALRADGSVWAWGSNSFGQLGDGTTTDRLNAIQVGGLTGVIAVSAGRKHTAALKGDGSVWAWGNNSSGELGDGTTIRRSTPVLVSGLAGAVAISAGGAHTVALKGDGGVWAWGENFLGQLGDDTTAGRLTPVQVVGLTSVIAISAGGSFTVAVKGDGSVWAWGNNFDGQLGDGTTIQGSTPMQVSGLTGVVAISAGGAHTTALKGDGSVWSWGWSISGQVGDGTYVSRRRPAVVVAESGSGSLDANDWFLDLDPSAPGAIPAAFLPKALAVARILGSGGLDATVKYKSAEFGRSVNNYVLALVPPEFFDQVKTAPGSATARDLRAKAGETLVLAQLTPAGWTNAQGQLIAYSQGVANAAGGGANILDRIGAYPGARFCIGYGETADAMLTSQTLREILVLEGTSGVASDVPCVPSGVYLSGPPGSRLGTPVIFKASVVGLSPTGAVQFRDGSEALMSPVLLEAANEAVGTASIATASLTSGMHSIGAAYSGDGQNAARKAEIPLLHEVSSPPGGTRTDLSGPASSSQDREVAFIVTVTGNAPTGSVQLRDGGANLGAPVPLVQGTATVRVSTLSPGGHSIAALYSGDGANAASVSNAIQHIVYAALDTGVTLSSVPNPSSYGTPVTLTATVSGSSPTGSVTFRDGAAVLASVPLVDGIASTTIPALAAGTHVVVADYGGDGANQVASSTSLFHLVLGQAPASAPRPFAFAPAFNVVPGATVTSNAITVRGLAGAATISVAGGSYSIGCVGGFTTAAGVVPGGQTVCVRHTAASGFGVSALTALTIGGVSATFTSTTHSASFPASVSSLVTLYYQSILRRPADSGGQSFWASEAMRVIGLGANPSEAFYAMAMSFFGSAEYAGFNRDATAFVTDLYATFFGRTPDSGGLAFWTGNLDSGMPRDVVLASLLFSPEFAAAAQARLGAGASRAEVDAVMDFYRGLLGRLPDDGGFGYWVNRFRAAQCQGQAAILAEVEAISSAFTLSNEYIARARAPTQYVGDLYNAFLRRGGDLTGVQFWIGQVATGARTREQVRVAFRDSAEFQGRVAAIVAQGCL